MNPFPHNIFLFIFDFDGGKFYSNVLHRCIGFISSAKCSTLIPLIIARSNTHYTLCGAVFLIFFRIGTQIEVMMNSGKFLAVLAMICHIMFTSALIRCSPFTKYSNSIQQRSSLLALNLVIISKRFICLYC